MKNQVDYFKKCIKILEELKQDHPDIEISKHYLLATDGANFLSDKELYEALQKHRGELDMNSSFSHGDLSKIEQETEELFSEVEDDFFSLENDDYDEDGF